MQALILEEPRHLALTDLPTPELARPDDVLVQVHRIGVCGTDYHAWNGRQPFFDYPRVLGHELGVEVLATGPEVTSVRPGDRCAVEPYLDCGRCSPCRRGKPNCCASLRVLGVHVDGGLCPRLVVPAAKLHPAPNLDWDELPLVETLCIGCHAVQRAALAPDEWTLILGAGPIGLAVIQFALLASARVLVCDPDERRLAFCRSHFPAVQTLHPHSDLITQVNRLTGEEGPTVVFDATGNAESMQRAFSYPVPGGKLIFVGFVNADIAFHSPLFHRHETTLFASRNALPADFKRVITLISKKQINVLPWITHRENASRLIPQFAQWLQPGHQPVKAVIDMDLHV